MTRITSLTPQQEALLPVKRDEWIRHGLCTEPANRREAERGVRLAYQAAGLESPRFIIWVNSPYAGAFAQAIAPEIIKTAVGAQVWDQVGDQVRDQVWAQVGDQVRDQVWAQVRDQVRDQVGKWRNALISDYYAIWWSSWIDTMQALGVDGLMPWEGNRIIAQNAYWWWAFRGFVVISERPREINRDAEGRLHCDTGHAISWPDGWGFSAWHGTRVPDTLIAPGWDVATILREANQEIKRCAIDVYGWAEFIHDAGMTQVGDTVPDPGNPGHFLALFGLPEQIFGEPVRVMTCTNGTPERDGTRRVFGLTVPAEIPDPLTAAAWGYEDPDHPVRVTAETYAQLARRR